MVLWSVIKHKNMAKQDEKSGKKIRVIELFAGVGGFRLGLEANNRKGSGYEVVWSNQWEPSTRKQHASEAYVARFGEVDHSNQDIAKVPTSEIPDHDLLVGGFPCQDYSVARTLSQAAGIKGKKGVLWWEIERILKDKAASGRIPKYLILENVDRLLKSPASKRGKDFAVMLASLSDLGYAVEWRVVNAAEYGMPQRRRRVFILGYHRSSAIYKELSTTEPSKWIISKGVHAQAFPASPVRTAEFEIEGDLARISDKFNLKEGSGTPFLKSGVMRDRKVTTIEVDPIYEGKKMQLKDILLAEKDVPKDFFIDPKDLPKWRYLKGGKKEERHTKDGMTYFYNEGPMVFPDPPDRPSRTIVTGEGGSTPSRFKHVVQTKSGRYRRLTPVELERLCMFPDNHTAGHGDSKRAFFMGNALVVGVIERLGKALLERHLGKGPSRVYHGSKSSRNAGPKSKTVRSRVAA